MKTLAQAVLIGIGSVCLALAATSASAQVLDSAFTVQEATDTLAVFHQVVAVQTLTTGQTRQRLTDGLAVWGDDAAEVEAAPRWSAWGGASGALYDFDDEDFDGRGFSALAGIDHLLSDDFVLGFAIGYDRTAFETRLLDTPGDFDGQSYTFNFYGGWLASEAVLVDGFLSYTRTNLDIDQGTAAGDTTSDRASGGVGVTLSHAVGPLVVQPRISAAIAFDSQITYFDSNGNDIENERSALFRGTGGARITYPLSFGDMRLRPWAEAAIEGTLDDVGDAALLGDTFSGRFGGGMDFKISDWAISLSGGVAGIGGRDFTEFGGRLQIAYPF
ncbi:MAG: autotransporter outer membrane beta-barrel domain-containing protein [Pseudomonadota bacterium]